MYDKLDQVTRVACLSQIRCNFFEAMGGESSVKTLVERSYANKDYTHLNYKGGKELARKMFPSFKEGYKNYVRRKAIEKK